MSLYNMLFGMNANADQLLFLLGKKREDFGRFRNVYVDAGFIVVYTRCGGGNREDWPEVFDLMAAHPWFSHDEDDEFDSTYCCFYFKIPQENQLKSYIATLEQGDNPANSWHELLESLKGQAQ